MKKKLDEILMKNSEKNELPAQAVKFDKEELPEETVEKLRALGYLQ